MFTGIVEELGTIVSLDGPRLRVMAPVVSSDASVDDSIAVSGVCLTVVEREGELLGFDVSSETMARTSLGERKQGDRVNLERPLTLQTRLGGHLVQGHVDAVGRVVSLGPEAVGATLSIEIPSALRRYVVEKGSLTVDGVSLTVADLTPDGCRIALIPHTMAATTLGTTGSGASVNLEVDIIARYVEAMHTEGANP